MCEWGQEWSYISETAKYQNLQSALLNQSQHMPTDIVPIFNNPQVMSKHLYISPHTPPLYIISSTTDIQTRKAIERGYFRQWYLSDYLLKGRLYKNREDFLKSIV